MAESLSKSVQELVVNGNELPERYIISKGKGFDGTIDSSLPVIEILVIDLGLLTSTAPAGEAELQKLRSALSSCGCFQLINHGMESSYLDQVHEVGKKFFALPKEEKVKCSRTVDDTEGYGNDTLFPQQQTVDWTDRLYLTVNPQQQRKLSVWPQNPQSFREILDEYTKKLEELNTIILKAMAKSLNLEENCFLKQYGELAKATVIARFNYYPPCPRPDLALGVKPHADASAITFLLQDKKVEGLQVLNNGQWFRVPTSPHSLLINVGDQVEIMSNGLLKSPVHRVVTNSERERMTLAVFFVPHSEQVIEPVEELVTDKRPRLYRKVKDYVSIYFENYQLGKRPIQAVLL
ncbi:hypothetical protein LguiB_024476 [Lonicera macranthoides]